MATRSDFTEDAHLRSDGSVGLEEVWDAGEQDILLSRIGLLDTDSSHHLFLAVGSDLSAEKVLTLAPGDADRTITLTGNPTLDDWFNQNVKSTASPSFSNVGIAAKITHVADADTFMEFNPDTITFEAGGLLMLTLKEGVLANEVTVNDGGINVDFRVETDNDANALRCDSVTDRVTIGGNLAVGKFNVVGAVYIKDTNKLIIGQTDGNEYINSPGDGQLTVQATDDLFINGNPTAIGDGGRTNWLDITNVGDMIFHGGAGLPFAEISAANATDTIAIAVAGQANKIQATSFDTNGVSNQMTPDHTNDHITVVHAGMYLCIVSLHVATAGAGGADEFGFSVYKNNGSTEFPNVHSHRRMSGGGGDVGSMPMSGIIDLAAGDTVELWCWNEDSADDIVIEDVTLSLLQIGGT